MMSMLKFPAGPWSALVMALIAGGAARAQTPGETPPATLVDVAPAAAPAAPRGLSEGVAAIVNDNPISTYDLNQRVRLLVVTSGVRPTPENMPQIEREALRSLIDERLEVQEIKKEEKSQKFTIMADDKEVNDDLEHIAHNAGMTGKQLLAGLTSAGVDPATLREQLRAQISWDSWIHGRYGGTRMKISTDQVNGVLRQIEAEAAKPQYQIAEIFIDAARAGGIGPATDAAKQIIQQLNQGAPFAGVARQFSGATTAANGGDAGWLTTAEMPQEMAAVVEQMRPNTLSAPIPVQNGVYIVLLRDKRAGSDSSVVNLKQAAISLPADASAAQLDAAREKLLALKGRIASCDTMLTTASKTEGVVAGDLGDADVKDLAPAFRDAVQTLRIGQISEPIRTQAGLHLIALCGKHQAGINLPPREEIESRLQEQQLSLISRRYLRDLRSSATIDMR